MKHAARVYYITQMSPGLNSRYPLHDKSMVKKENASPVGIRLTTLLLARGVHKAFIKEWESQPDCRLAQGERLVQRKQLYGSPKGEHAIETLVKVAMDLGSIMHVDWNLLDPASETHGHFVHPHEIMHAIKLNLLDFSWLASDIDKVAMNVTQTGFLIMSWLCCMGQQLFTTVYDEHFKDTPPPFGLVNRNGLAFTGVKDSLEVSPIFPVAIENDLLFLQGYENPQDFVALGTQYVRVGEPK